MTTFKISSGVLVNSLLVAHEVRVNVESGLNWSLALNGVLNSGSRGVSLGGSIVAGVFFGSGGLACSSST